MLFSSIITVRLQPRFIFQMSESSTLLFHSRTHSSVYYSPPARTKSVSRSSSVHKCFFLLIMSYEIISLDPIDPPLPLSIFATSLSINVLHFSMQSYSPNPSSIPLPIIFSIHSSFLIFPGFPLGLPPAFHPLSLLPLPQGSL